jgi:putative phosphoserine phosphatase/1-acylglycerol-3-phosphate O-acyltransferase
MSGRRELTQEVDRAPGGPKIAAFFDVDRTLLAGFSAAAFLRDKSSRQRNRAADSLRAAAGALRFALGRTSFPGFIEQTSTGLIGLAQEELAEVGRRVFAQQLVTDIYPESRALVEAHQRRGHTVAIVSSATHMQVDALAAELGIGHVLCTELEFEHGRFTGRVVRPAVFREGKATAAQGLAAACDLDLSASYFYTDSRDDLALLDLVGNPRLVNPDAELAKIGARRGWPVYRFTSRGRPGVRELAGLLGAVSALGPAALVGIPTALASRNLRQGVGAMWTTFAELGTALSGVELQVEGEQHLYAQRPAVFIFNHQSALDSLLMARLVRRDVVGVAKRELESAPVLGALLRLAGTVFVDRGDRAQATLAMQPAIDAMREGWSVAIAPEGTRSATQKLGPFKKGAFRMAMAAGVPIVPVVIRNALDALPKGGLVIRPATVEVVVHPPIPTTGWTRETLDERIAEVRRLFDATLAG